MSVSSFSLCRLMVGSLLSMLAVFAHATTYTIVDLGDFGQGTKLRPYGMNASGQVVGDFNPITGGLNTGFLYSDGALTKIAGLGSSAQDINDSGQVTGGFQSQAYIYSGGSFTFLGTLGGGSSSGRSINAYGQVTGSSYVPGGNSHAFLYSNGTMTDLGTLGGTGSVGYSINASGQITGYSTTASGRTRAFLYGGTTMVDIGTLPGFDDCWGESINDSGRIVGYCRKLPNTIRAFLYDAGSMMELGTLGGNISIARSINNAGQIVGGAFNANNQARAFLYSKGTMIDLSTLLPADSGWDFLYEAWAINDAGQITGQGFRNGVLRAFLLTPSLPGVTLSPTSLTLTEGGTPGTYAVTLTSMPSDTVTVAIASDAQLAVSPATLTFSAANWNVPQTVTVQAVQDGVAEGPHTATIHHSAASADPNYNGVSLGHVTVSINDNVPPVVYNPVPAGVIWTQPDLPVSGTAQPGATLVLNIANLSVNAFGNQSVTVAADGSWNLTLTGLSDGLYELQPEVGGVKGNKVSVAVDSHAPVSTLSVTPNGPPDNGWYAGAVTLTVTAADGAGGQGLDRSEFALDGGAWLPVPAGGVVLNVDGSHDFCYRSIDKAGNIEAARCVAVAIDATAPSVNPVFDAANNLLHLSAQDAVSGIASVEISRDGGQTWIAQSGPIGFTRDGNHTVLYRVRDRAGNLATGQASVTVATRPVITAPAGQNAFEAASQNFNLGSFSDQAADSPWNIDVDWGDGSVHGLFTLTAPGALGNLSHTYADNSTYTVTVRVTDFAGNVGSNSFSIAVANVAPAATFTATSGPLNEGDVATLAFSNPTDPSPVDTQAGFRYAFDCGGGNGFGAAGTASSVTCLALDNPNQTTRGRVIDKDGGVTEYSTLIAVNNVAPALGPIAGPTSPVVRNTPATITANFTDPGVRDMHTVTVDWADGTASAGTVTEANGSGSISASHSYTHPGRYIVTVTLTDKDGASTTATYTAIQIRGGPPEH